MHKNRFVIVAGGNTSTTMSMRTMRAMRTTLRTLGIIDDAALRWAVVVVNGLWDLRAICWQLSLLLQLLLLPVSVVVVVVPLAYKTICAQSKLGSLNDLRSVLLTLALCRISRGSYGHRVWLPHLPPPLLAPFGSSKNVKWSLPAAGIKDNNNNQKGSTLLIYFRFMH